MKPALSEQALFAEAVLLDSPEARAAFLQAACGTDAVLRRRVEALLRAAGNAGDFLEESPALLPGSAGSTRVVGELTEKPGDTIGRYKLLQRIGEGGCGVVYMAEQEEPVRRRVALKILKPGMDTRLIVARFEAERQALALMDHPNIARVFDGGATPSGRPYFVMELVRGVRITAFCADARLSTESRLRLFTQVCQAIQHAHQKGIIHRDIKPSNILVTVNDGAPVPKVIDFGIAKATGQRLTDKTLFTQFHSFIGTPAYTSPEQMEMSSVDIDTRSDIYSLGVLLYELLTGRTPFDGEELLRSGLDEMRRVIREEEPVKPSTRLTQDRAATRSVRPGQSELHNPKSDIDTDLDAIVMKCLEKDRARRYETANGVAADVLRRLNHEPILARPPSPMYRFRKMVRRNRAMFATTVAVAVSLFAGTIVSVWQAVRAHRSETRVRTALADLRASAPAYAAQARGLVAGGQVTEALEKLDYAIHLRPESTEYLLAKGNLLESQLQFAEAAPIYRAALRLDPNDPRAVTNLALCERLRALHPGQPLWNETLAALFSVMTLEKRPEPEMRRISGLVIEPLKERLAAVEALAGHRIADRLTISRHGSFHLELQGTSIADFSPLQGLPVGRLGAAGTAVTDLRPLRSLPLTLLNIAGTRVTNLEPLRGMQALSSLHLNHSAATDLSPLQGLRIWWLDLNGTRVRDLTALRGLPLGVLRLRDTPVTNLAPLAGMPLSELDCTSIPATDFSPLANCPALSQLLLANTSIKSLDMLRGLKLVGLIINNTDVRDLSPVAGMPLQVIGLHDTDITDVSPLLQCPTLHDITLPRSARNVALLRALPSLRRIGYHREERGAPAKTAAEFWAEFDNMRAARK